MATLHCSAQRLLIAVASLVEQQGVRHTGFSSCSLLALECCSVILNTRWNVEFECSRDVVEKLPEQEPGDLDC